MKEYRRIYENNKRLDEIFIEKYEKIENFYEYNCIEMLVELGEFINETKCFKFWSIKIPNKEKMLEEYADCITMILVFFNFFDLEIEEKYSHIESKNICDVINCLFLLSTDLMKREENVVKKLFGNLLYLGECFDFSKEEIIDAIDKKHRIIEERLNTDY